MVVAGSVSMTRNYRKGTQSTTRSIGNLYTDKGGLGQKGPLCAGMLRGFLSPNLNACHSLLKLYPTWVKRTWKTLGKLIALAVLSIENHTLGVCVFFLLNKWFVLYRNNWF